MAARLSPSGRARTRSDARSDFDAARNSDSGSQPEPDSDTQSQPDTGPQHTGRCNEHHLCRMCNTSFSSMTSLRRHRNAYRLANTACRDAGQKRHQTDTADRNSADSASRDAIDRIQRMMSDGLAPGAAPLLEPRDAVGDKRSETNQAQFLDMFLSCLIDLCVNFKFTEGSSRHRLGQ